MKYQLNKKLWFVQNAGISFTKQFCALFFYCYYIGFFFVIYIQVEKFFIIFFLYCRDYMSARETSNVFLINHVVIFLLLLARVNGQNVWKEFGSRCFDDLFWTLCGGELFWVEAKCRQIWVTMNFPEISYCLFCL